MTNPTILITNLTNDLILNDINRECNSFFDINLEKHQNISENKTIISIFLKGSNND